jgi:hypothetical protein
MLIRSSDMWSQFYKKYKKSQMEPPVEGDDQTAAGIAGTDMSTYIAKQSTTVASAFLGTSHKKGGIKQPAEGGLPVVSKTSGPLVFTSSGSRHVPRPAVRNECFALSVLQDVLLGRG